MLIWPNNDESFLMGLPFFQGYYTHHDMEQSRIGFIPNNLSLKDYITKADVLPKVVIASPS